MELAPTIHQEKLHHVPEWSSQLELSEYAPQITEHSNMTVLEIESHICGPECMVHSRQEAIDEATAAIDAILLDNTIDTKQVITERVLVHGHKESEAHVCGPECTIHTRKEAIEEANTALDAILHGPKFTHTAIDRTIRREVTENNPQLNIASELVERKISHEAVDAISRQKTDFVAMQQRTILENQQYATLMDVETASLAILEQTEVTIVPINIPEKSSHVTDRTSSVVVATEQVVDTTGALGSQNEVTMENPAGTEVPAAIAPQDLSHQIDSNSTVTELSVAQLDEEVLAYPTQEQVILADVHSEFAQQSEGELTQTSKAWDTISTHIDMVFPHTLPNKGNNTDSAVTDLQVYERTPDVYVALRKKMLLEIESMVETGRQINAIERWAVGIEEYEQLLGTINNGLFDEENTHKTIIARLRNFSSTQIDIRSLSSQISSLTHNEKELVLLEVLQKELRYKLLARDRRIAPSMSVAANPADEVSNRLRLLATKIVELLFTNGTNTQVSWSR